MNYFWTSLFFLSFFVYGEDSATLSQDVHYKLVDLRFESSGLTAGYYLDDPIIVAIGYGHPVPELVDRYLWENSQLEFEILDNSSQLASSLDSEESRLALKLVIDELTNGFDDQLGIGAGVGSVGGTFVALESCFFSIESCEIGYGPSSYTFEKDLFGYRISEIAIANIEFTKNWFNNRFPCRTASGCTEYSFSGNLEIYGRAIPSLIGDADNDGLGDSVDSDDDNDGLADDIDPDDDNDGFSDEEELADGTNPLSRFSCRSGCFSFDVDESLQAQPLTDGLLVIRHLFGFSGDALTSGAVASDAKRDASEVIASYLTDADSQLDIDGDSESKPLTDGLLLIRYLFGFSGDSLISGAIGDGAERDTADAVEAYIQERIPVQ